MLRVGTITKVTTKGAPTKRAKADSRATQQEPRPDATTIAGRLVICRIERKLSQAEAARLIKKKQPSLGNLETGKSKEPKASTLLDMRDKLGYDPDYVIRGRGMPLLPNYEEVVKEQTLIAIFRELRPEIRDEALKSVQALRRAQGGSSPSDPFLRDPPKSDD